MISVVLRELNQWFYMRDRNGSPTAVIDSGWSNRVQTSTAQIDLIKKAIYTTFVAQQHSPELRWAHFGTMFDVIDLHQPTLERRPAYFLELMEGLIRDAARGVKQHAPNWDSEKAARAAIDSVTTIVNHVRPALKTPHR